MLRTGTFAIRSVARFSLNNCSRRPTETAMNADGDVERKAEEVLVIKSRRGSKKQGQDSKETRH